MEHMEQNKPTCDVCGMAPVVSRWTKSAFVVSMSPVMQEVCKRAARFAVSLAPVVIYGETGTGKEVIARLIHQNSRRANQPFVAINVAALPTELLESELFGHGKGAFTGAASSRRGLMEEAASGTLFLDEIGEMALPIQAKLLRALQDGEIRRVGENQTFAVDLRIVCATHRDLAELVREGKFRQDLYFRLKVLTLTMPPLRDRKEDVLPLARTFLAEEAVVAQDFSNEAQQQLQNYAWPGNVRELQNAVRHGAALATGLWIEARDLPEELRQNQNRFRAEELSATDQQETWTLAEMERRHILRVMDLCQGNQAMAADKLGIARNTLWRKLRLYS
ncbi:MAG: sigma-54-dependent Fis family transcriptional regulator [Myxococcales bacterium]|nr:sigma-54-dependent Fis family transcriptional regulator [Myxococcales bacterium]